MFIVKRHSENRLDIEMSGRLDSEAMKRALDELVSQSSDIEDGTMLYDVVDFHLPSLAAVVVEFSRLPSMLGFMKKFRRAAVLTDKAWLQKVSELEAFLYPGLEIRAFDRDQRKAAEEWLTEK
jgi:hypothetical protein